MLSSKFRRTEEEIKGEIIKNLRRDIEVIVYTNYTFEEFELNLLKKFDSKIFDKLNDLVNYVHNCSVFELAEKDNKRVEDLLKGLFKIEEFVNRYKEQLINDEAVKDKLKALYFYR